MTNQPPKWEERIFKLKDLSPYEHNPRRITKQQFEKLKKSLQEDGFHQRLIADREGKIIGGHARLQALQELGFKEVAVLIPDRDLTPEEFDRINIRDNIGFGDFNYDMLANRFDVETLADWGMTDAMLANILKIEPDIQEETDDLPELTDNPVSKTGDVWILGNHRLMCGDSTNASDVEKLLNGVKPHLMCTDPPYGIEYDAAWRDGALGGKDGGRATGKVTNDDKADWSAAYALFPGEVAYVWHAGTKAHVVAQNLISCGFDIRTQIIWAKSHFAIGRGHYHVQHEPCWYAVKQKGTGHWAGDRKQATVWQIDKPQKSETGHSTQKPVECMRKPMENNSSPGQAVYEPFAGSGTSIIAAEQIGRHCYAMEISESYVDMGVIRWMNLTKQDAILEATGAKFGAV